jgi:hypothetical protein
MPAGVMPLPPYIKREATTEDAERYQTIYAATDGSVAAPTAGLHFTPEIFSSLREKKINTDFVTLHVGAGTFKPVKASTMETHEMHAEFIDVSSGNYKKSFGECGKIYNSCWHHITPYIGKFILAGSKIHSGTRTIFKRVECASMGSL